LEIGWRLKKRLVEDWEKDWLEIGWRLKKRLVEDWEKDWLEIAKKIGWKRLVGD